LSGPCPLDQVPVFIHTQIGTADVAKNGEHVKSSKPHDGRSVLGRRVRELRRRRGNTLKDVGDVSGISKSTLSKIENGTLSVSYDNLIKLAHALSVDVSELFAESSGDASTQANGRRSIAHRGSGEIYETAQYRYELLCNDLNPKKLFPMIATLRAHSVSSAKELIRHSGEEFAFVLTGTVEVHSEFYSPLTLNPGEGVYFDSTMGHALISSDDADAKILWIATNAITPDPKLDARTADTPKRVVKRSRHS
jgi:transcriptional regulator with XRE-family HTH domain